MTWAAALPGAAPNRPHTRQCDVFKRRDGVNEPFVGQAPQGSRAIEREGHYVARGLLTPDATAALCEEVLATFDRLPPDPRAGRTSPDNAAMFRYEMFNRSARCQDVIAHPDILAIVEPLLGEDCHVISCTAWRNPPGAAHAPRGQEWHIDGGPFVPRARIVRWPRGISYPIFVIATHIYLEDCTLDDGPTAVVPGSHTSGRPPPYDRRWDAQLTYRMRRSVPHVTRAGDVGFFVSDAWHRRLPPTERSTGRFFLQTNYGRRDIAQRVRPTSVVSHTSEEARRRADTERKRRLIGLHPEGLYDG